MSFGALAARGDSPARHAGPSRRRARRLCAGLAGLALLPAATGCYTYRHLPEGTLPLGSSVALGITDRGRVEVGEQIGPGVLRIRGELVSRTDSSYVLRVAAIEHLNGRTTRWSGEQVEVPREAVGTVAEHRYSRGRTWLAISGAVLGVALVATAISLDTFGGGRDDGEGGGQEPQ